MPREPKVGGSNLPTLTLMGANEELWRTIVPFRFPPDSPNLRTLAAVATMRNKQAFRRR